MVIKVIDKDGNTVAENSGSKEVNLDVARAYVEGDCIILEPDEPGFYWLQVDDALGKSMVYVTGSVCYRVPFAEKRTNLSPKAFWEQDIY